MLCIWADWQWKDACEYRFTVIQFSFSVLVASKIFIIIIIG